MKLKIKPKTSGEKLAHRYRDAIAFISWVFLCVCVAAVISIAMILMHQHAQAKVTTIQSGSGFVIVKHRLEPLEFGGALERWLANFDADLFPEDLTEDEIRAHSIDKAFHLIKGEEGFVSHCYEDGHKMVDGETVVLYSHGYGHKCLGGTISEARSQRVMKNSLWAIYNRIRLEYPDLDSDALGALVSYSYNTPRTEPATRNAKFIKAIKEGNESHIRWHMFRYNASHPGHVPRRNRELELIFKTK